MDSDDEKPAESQIQLVKALHKEMVDRRIVLTTVASKRKKKTKRSRNLTATLILPTSNSNSSSGSEACSKTTVSSIRSWIYFISQKEPLNIYSKRGILSERNATLRSRTRKLAFQNKRFETALKLLPNSNFGQFLKEIRNVSWAVKGSFRRSMPVVYRP